MLNFQMSIRLHHLSTNKRRFAFSFSLERGPRRRFSRTSCRLASGISRFSTAQRCQAKTRATTFSLKGPESIGRPRASEAVRLLRELNDSVVDAAELRVRLHKLCETTCKFKLVIGKDISTALSKGASYFSDFYFVIARNIPYSQLNQLSEIAWSDATLSHLIARFFNEYHEHTSEYFPTSYFMK